MQSQTARPKVQWPLVCGLYTSDKNAIANRKAKSPMAASLRTVSSSHKSRRAASLEAQGRKLQGCWLQANSSKYPLTTYQRCKHGTLTIVMPLKTKPLTQTAA